MKQRQILYSKQMILAKLAGRKTVTRRPVKPQPEYASMFSEFRYQDKNGDVHRFANDDGMLIDEHYEKQRCPYGQPGDRLWTRENFEVMDSNERRHRLLVWYPADESSEWVALSEAEWQKYEQWNQPIGPKSKLHMFRSLSRFLDEVTEVRVDRVQDITEKQALAEGIYFDNELKKYVAGPDAFCLANSPKHSFQLLWQSMYEFGPFDWNYNPYVWVVRYKPLAVNQPENQNFELEAAHV